MEQIAQGSGGVTAPAGAQEVTGHGTGCCDFVDKMVFGQKLDSKVFVVFSNFNDFMIIWKEEDYGEKCHHLFMTLRNNSKLIFWLKYQYLKFNIFTLCAYNIMLIVWRTKADIIHSVGKNQKKITRESFFLFFHQIKQRTWCILQDLSLLYHSTAKAI